MALGDRGILGDEEQILSTPKTAARPDLGPSALSGPLGGNGPYTPIAGYRP